MAELASMAPTAGGQYRTCANSPTNESHPADWRQIGCLSLRHKSEVSNVQSRERMLTGSHCRHQKFMSYLTGWYAVLGWQTSLVGTALAPAQLFQAVVILYNPSFASKGILSASRDVVCRMKLTVSLRRRMARDVNHDRAHLHRDFHQRLWVQEASHHGRHSSAVVFCRRRRLG